MNATTQVRRVLVLSWFVFCVVLVEALAKSPGCDPAAVHWSISEDHRSSSFHWRKPDCHPILKHFGGNGDVAKLLEGKEVLLLGNSNLRILTSTLYGLVGRRINEKAIVEVPLAGEG
jgi:hypothetical protein